MTDTDLWRDLPAVHQQSAGSLDTPDAARRGTTRHGAARHDTALPQQPSCRRSRHLPQDGRHSANRHTPGMGRDSLTTCRRVIALHTPHCLPFEHSASDIPVTAPVEILWAETDP
ncbi:hypothetical protein ACOMHN_051036 [Nucella lapillus]